MADDLWSGTSYPSAQQPGTTSPDPGAGNDAWHGAAYSNAVPGATDPITGRPYQFAGSMPAGDPVGQATGRPIREDTPAGFGTQAAASFSTDPEQKRRIIASQLFPDLKPAEAQSRVFYGVNGRMAAVGLDGKPFYVEPDVSLSRPSTLTPDNLAAGAGALVGPALPAVGAVAGGMMAGPSSMVVGPVAAGAGAAAGDAARQYGARYFDPQPEKAPAYSYGQTALEAAGGAGGQLLGAGALRILAPNRLGAAMPDIRAVRSGPTMANAEQVNQLAASQGVRLTPGQATGLPSLLSNEDVIASGSAGTDLGDIARTYYQGQRQELQNANRLMLDRISPASDKTDAAMQFQQGAEDATRLTRQNANAAARPAYEAAQQAGQVMSPDLAQLADAPAVRSAMDAARTDYQNLYRRSAPSPPDFALWDLTKRKLDDAVTTARRAGENTTAMAADTLRSDLVTHLDAAYPTYAAARETAAPGQRLAARLESSVGSAVGDGTEKARAIVAPVFEGNNPRAIGEARDAFIAAGREGDWNAGTRAYIQDAFDRASKSQEGLNPASLRMQLWGNQDTRAAMQAAMGPQQFEGFSNFMQVVEAVARSRGMNSLTAPRQAGAAALEEVAGQSPGVRAANLVGSALNPMRLAQVGSVLPDRIATALTERNLRGIAQRLFSPEGMTYLRQMAGMSPTSQTAVAATARFLGQQAGEEMPVLRRNALSP